MSLTLYKGQAKRLASHLSTVHDVSLGHSHALEAVAAIHGYRDWNTLVAADKFSVAPAGAEMLDPGVTIPGGAPHAPGDRTALMDIGFAPRQLAQLDTALARLDGLFIVAGAIGSGRTTTMQALVEAFNPGGNWTVLALASADLLRPVSGAAYLPLNANDPDAHRQVLALHPDVVIMGEIREAAAAQLALALVENGCHVLATMHARSADDAIKRLSSSAWGVSDRLQEVWPHPVAAVVWQTLLPRLCPACHQSAKGALPAGEPERLAASYGVPAERLYVKGTPSSPDTACVYCQGHGTSSYVAVAEIQTPGLGQPRARMSPLEHAVERLRDGLVDVRDVEALAVQVAPIAAGR